MLNNCNDIFTYTVDDAMNILQLCRNSVYALLRKDKIHGVKAGNVWRIPRSALENYLGYSSVPNQKKFSI